MTGTLRTSPNDFIDIHANIFPMELVLAKVCHNAVVRILTLPDTNPLHNIVQEYKNSQPSKHLSMLHKLLNLSQLADQHIETINTAAHLLPEKLLPMTTIDESRTKSLEIEANDNNNFRIYSDSSCQNGGVGAAAILFCKNLAQPLKSLQKYLGTKDDHNTYKAEIVGAILALWILQNTAETTSKK